MRPHSIVTAIILFTFFASSQINAADGAADKVSPTTMTERGKLQFSDDFSKVPDSKEWRAAKGKWELVEGSLKGAEVKADNHPAVTRHVISFKDVVIQYDFRLDGAKTTTLSINSTKEHVCRLLITEKGFSIQKDDQDHAGPDKVVKFQSRETPFKRGEWYTAVVEIRGGEMMVRIGDAVAYGEHPAIDVPKANLGFTVAGESVSFRNVRMWEASARSGWDKSKFAAVK